MRRRHVLPALAGAAMPAVAQTGSFVLQFRDSFLRHWQVERGYTLAVADAMPAEQYEFKPHPVQRSFGEQFVHLAGANTRYFSAFGLAPPPEPPAGAGKEIVRGYIDASWDYTIEVLKKLSEKDLLRADLGAPRFKPHSGVDLCLRAYTHTAHHRGQTIVYLRLKGIAPPAWSFEPTAGA
ncbi:MAG: DinB family protein [Bryobacteraceae bacterium]|nr:DinB family protein [Bryobacteraceae bacterium]